MSHAQRIIHVSLVAIPDVMLSSLIGLFDVLNCFELLATFDKALPHENPFHTEIIAQSREDNRTASGMPIAPPIIRLKNLTTRISLSFLL